MTFEFATMLVSTLLQVKFVRLMMLETRVIRIRPSLLSLFARLNGCRGRYQRGVEFAELERHACRNIEKAVVHILLPFQINTAAPLTAVVDSEVDVDPSGW